MRNISNPELFTRLMDLAEDEEPATTKSVSNILDWIGRSIVQDIKSGGTGEAALDAYLPDLEKALFDSHLSTALSLSLPAYKVAKALVSLSMRQNVIIRGKQNWATTPGFNDDARLFAYLKSHMENHLGVVSSKATETTEREIRSLLRNIKSSESSTNNIADAFKTSIEDRNVKRADMIARTTAVWIVNEAAQLAYKDIGIGRKTWWAVGDEKMCPFCNSLDGLSLDIDGTFAEEGTTINTSGVNLIVGMDVSHPPLHPHCRCLLLVELE